MFRCFAASLLVWGALSGAALADGRIIDRQISWEDLIPKGEPLTDPLRGVDLSVRKDLAYLARIDADVRQGFLEPDSAEVEQSRQLIAKRAAAGVDLKALSAAVVELQAEIDRRGADVDKSLDGQVIRMPGYALPLEFVEGGIREFLLVPFVGACIHVPPPPPNQMVFVDLEEEVVIEGLFQPVWVTGRMRVEAGTRSLSFVDGVADVALGYALEDVVVEPYR